MESLRDPAKAITRQQHGPTSGRRLKHPPLWLVHGWVLLVDFHLVPSLSQKLQGRTRWPSVSITAFHNFAFGANTPQYRCLCIRSGVISLDNRSSNSSGVRASSVQPSTVGLRSEYTKVSSFSRPKKNGSLKRLPFPSNHHQSESRLPSSGRSFS